MVIMDRPIVIIDMSKVDEDINNQVSDIPPKKRKTQE